MFIFILNNNEDLQHLLKSNRHPHFYFCFVVFVVIDDFVYIRKKTIVRVQYTLRKIYRVFTVFYISLRRQLFFMAIPT